MQEEINKLKITKEQVNDAFLAEQKIYEEFNQLKNNLNRDDHFFYANIEDEFHESSAILKNNIWHYPKKVNYKKKSSFSIWRDFPNYNCYGSNTPEDTLRKSEQEKILYQNNKFRISLYRDEVDGPTDTYWGHKIRSPKYALLNKKGEIIYIDEKKWRFEAILLNEYNPKKPETIYDVFKLKCNPFRYYVIPFSNKEKIKVLSDKLEWLVNTPFNFIEKKEYKEGYVVFLLGLDYYYKKKKYLERHERSTWMVFYGKHKPSFEDILGEIVSLSSMYSDHEDIISLFLSLKNEYSYDLNTLDLRHEERMLYTINKKFLPAIERIFNTAIEKILELIHENI